MRVFLLLFVLSVPGTIGDGDDKGESHDTLVYLDLETTGLSTSQCEILQITAKAGDKEFNKYILPKKKIPAKATSYNHITKRDGKLHDHDKEVSTVGMKKALISFIEFLKDAAAPTNRVVLVAHNGNRFDYPIILREMKRNELLESFLEIAVSSVDTLPVLREKTPCKEKSCKLAALAEQYDINRGDADEATADVRVLMEVIQKAGISDSELISCAKKMSEFIP